MIYLCHPGDAGGPPRGRRRRRPTRHEAAPGRYAPRLRPPRGCDPMQGGPRPDGPEVPPRPEMPDGVGCYRKLLDLLHPRGLACPRCGARDGLAVHRRHRDPVLDYMLARLPPRLQRLDRDRAPGDATAARPHLPDPLGDRLGDPGRRTARDLGAVGPGLVPMRRRLRGLARLALERGAVRRDPAADYGARAVAAGSRVKLSRADRFKRTADVPGRCPRGVAPPPRTRPARPPDDTLKTTRRRLWHRILDDFRRRPRICAAIPPAISMWGVDIPPVHMQSVGRDCLMNQM